MNRVNRKGNEIFIWHTKHRNQGNQATLKLAERQENGGPVALHEKLYSGTFVVDTLPKQTTLADFHEKLTSVIVML